MKEGGKEVEKEKKERKEGNNGDINSRNKLIRGWRNRHTWRRERKRRTKNREKI